MKFQFEHGEKAWLEDAYYIAVILTIAQDSYLRRSVIGQPIPLQPLLKYERNHRSNMSVEQNHSFHWEAKRAKKVQEALTLFFEDMTPVT